MKSDKENTMNLKYCECCTKKLKVLDVTFDLYQNICECYLLEGKPFSLPVLDSLYFPLMSLERKGFLITTEDGESNISIKPIGVYSEEDGPFICPGICERKRIVI
jgi:hypothetical protein